MPFLTNDNLLTYATCQRPDCPDQRPGTEHAHLIAVEHLDDEPSYPKREVTWTAAAGTYTAEAVGDG